MGEPIATLRIALGDGRVTPQIVEGRTPSLANDDEIGIVSDVRDQSSGWSTFMVYEDSAGNRSERRVTCRSISGDGRPVYLMGYCHERQAPRSFRIDRIVELIDYRTGEVVEALRHFEELRMHGLLPMRDRNLADLAVVMVYMAKCDGEFHPLEVDAIEEGLSRYLLRAGGTDAELEKVLSHLPALAPDADDVVAAVSRILRAETSSSLSRLILDCSSSVMAADGIFHNEEAAWSSKLCAILQEAV